MVSNYVGICDCINDDFKYLCDEKYLKLVKVNDEESTIINTKYRFAFNHESPGHADLYLKENWIYGKDHFVINDYENLKKRYTNRIKNFVDYLTNPNNRITFIMNTWNKTDNDIQ